MKMFVGSSTEGLDFARTLRDSLVPERQRLNVVMWDELFRNMGYLLEALTDGLTNGTSAHFSGRPTTSASRGTGGSRSPGTTWSSRQG